MGVLPYARALPLGRILDFLGFFAGWFRRETNRGAVGAAGLWGVLGPALSVGSVLL